MADRFYPNSYDSSDAMNIFNRGRIPFEAHGPDTPEREAMVVLSRVAGAYTLCNHCYEITRDVFESAKNTVLLACDNN